MKKKENEPKLGDQVMKMAWDVSKVVNAGLQIFNPITYVVLAVEGIKVGLNAIDDLVTEELNKQKDNQEATQNNNIIITNNNATATLSQVDYEQIQADHDLAMLLSGDSGDQS
jgi:hypothetical protein